MGTFHVLSPELLASSITFVFLLRSGVYDGALVYSHTLDSPEQSEPG